MARRREGSRVGTLVLVVFVGLAIAVISVGEALEVGGDAWLAVGVGLVVALVATVVLVIDPPGGRRRD